MSYRSQYIYFIRGGGFVKVGRAADVQSRLGDLQVGNPLALELLHSVWVPEKDVCFYESCVHSALEPLWVRGEWFRFEEPVPALIDRIRACGQIEWSALRMVRVYWQKHLATLVPPGNC